MRAAQSRNLTFQESLFSYRYHEQVSNTCLAERIPPAVDSREAQGRWAIDGLAGLARTSGVNLSGESFRFFEVFRANIWLQQRQVL